MTPATLSACSAAFFLFSQLLSFASESSLHYAQLTTFFSFFLVLVYQLHEPSCTQTDSHHAQMFYSYSPVSCYGRTLPEHYTAAELAEADVVSKLERPQEHLHLHHWWGASKLTPFPQ